MRDVNTAFTRAMLVIMHETVKKLVPNVNLRKDAWTHDAGHGLYEFHVVEREGVVQKFYWYGKCWNATEARYEGWRAYLTKFHGEALAALEG